MHHNGLQGQLNKDFARHHPRVSDFIDLRQGLSISFLASSRLVMMLTQGPQRTTTLASETALNSPSQWFEAWKDSG